ncbi:hypothetical protein DPSP01_003122 [Paraphaeosphaeria sporulosa]
MLLLAMSKSIDVLLTACIFRAQNRGHSIFSLQWTTRRDGNMSSNFHKSLKQRKKERKEGRKEIKKERKKEREKVSMGRGAYVCLIDKAGLRRLIYRSCIFGPTIFGSLGLFSIFGVSREKRGE